MPPSARPQPDLADVVALGRALHEDTSRLNGKFRERERRIARALTGRRDDPVALAMTWLEAVKAEDERVRRVYRHAEAATQITGLALVLGGGLLGWGATLAAFYFDGSGRVNAVSVLALLVALPAVMLLPYFLAALPATLVRRLPGAGALAALARAVSAARLAPLVWRILPREMREAMAVLSGRSAPPPPLYVTLRKWALLRWSQLFAVAFHISALFACLVLIVFTDLAFGWSTTLTTGDAGRDAGRVHRITSAIAAPWGWLIPEARPSLALIEESRYYRVASEPVTREQAARLGGWWRFVVMTIAIYGLLPRLLTLALARLRLRAAARAAVITTPGFSALLRRIHRARVETQAVQAEASAETGTVPAPAPPPVVYPRSGDIRALINWASVPVSPETLAAQFPNVPIHPAGGAATVQDDQALAARLAAAIDASGGDLLVVIKAWEPPLLEFGDFLRMLRGALPPPAMILVLPVGLDAGGGLPAPAPAQLKLWRDKLALQRDPWLRVVANAAEVRT